MEQQAQTHVNDDEARKCLTRVVVCTKPNSKSFTARLIAIEERYFVFETRLREVKRDLKPFIVSMKAVA